MHQLAELHWQTKKKIGKMSQFVIFVYIQAWFTAPSLYYIYSAASNDLLLYKRIIKFRSIHKKVSISTSTVFLRQSSPVVPNRRIDRLLSLQRGASYGDEKHTSV